MIRSNIGVEIKLTSIIPTLDIVFRQISTFLEDSVVVVWPEGRAGSGLGSTRNLARGPWVLSGPTRVRF